MKSERERGSAFGAVLAGGVVGVASAVLALEFPVLGWAFAAAFVVGGVVSRHRLAALGGILTAFGATWLVLFRASEERCRAFDQLPGSECLGPDLTPWYTLASGLTVAGVILLMAGFRRPRR